MIHPSIDQITQGKYNRYTLCIATAKCARVVTDEYVEQREIAEKMLANKETDKSIASMIKREIRDEKAVKTAIKRLYNGEFYIQDGDTRYVNARPAPAKDANEEMAEESAARLASVLAAEKAAAEATVEDAAETAETEEAVADAAGEAEPAE